MKSFKEFKEEQLNPSDLMLDNLWATMEKCYEAGQDEVSNKYKEAILNAAEKHCKDTKPTLFLCYVYSELNKL